MKNVALIVAAGRGVRAGTLVPKQYQPLAGQPLLSHSIAAFSRHPLVDHVRVVIHPDDQAEYESAARGFDLGAPVHGGATRQDSVRLGLEALDAAPDLLRRASMPSMPIRNGTVFLSRHRFPGRSMPPGFMRGSIPTRTSTAFIP